MKPIFKEEKEFLERKLNVEIPVNSWRNGSKIYLNHFDKKPFLTYKVDLLNDSLIIKKYDEPNLSDNLTLDEEYEKIKDDLEFKYKESISKTKEYILEHPDNKMFVSISGGKDSDVMKYIVDNAINELNDEGYDFKYNLIAFNTSNDTADTYKYLKQHHGMNKDNIISPKKGFYKWLVEDKNYFTPTRFVRNCCSTYKEGQLTSIMDKDENTLTFLGMRSQESNKRSFYDWDLNESWKKEKGKPNVPDNWLRFLPIVKWSDAEVWLFIIHNKLEYNKMYDYGFGRIGCAVCPFSQDYVDMLIKEHYPKIYSRWMDILSKGYDIYGVGKRLKWTREEWCEGGRWKNATSKEYELTTKSPTEERVKELAELKGISEDLARKYFKKECECGKKLNPGEVAMFLKIYGRYENVEDNRTYLCKKCLCKKLNITSKEYKEMMIDFIDQGCELF